MTTSKLFVVLGVLFVIAGGILSILPSREIQRPIACTQEAKICPDGSAVGRTGPNCEFALCPSLPSCEGEACFDMGIGEPPVGGGNGIAPYQSGIRGSVMMGPVCPVEQYPPDPNCADRGYETTLSISFASNPSKIFATARSAADGTFEVSLPPGEYIVAAAGGAVMPRCSDSMVTISPSSYTDITVSCDSGIR